MKVPPRPPPRVDEDESRRRELVVLLIDKGYSVDAAIRGAGLLMRFIKGDK